MTSSITVWYNKIALLQKKTSLLQSLGFVKRLFVYPSSEDIYLQKMKNKTSKIFKDRYHPAHKYFEFLPSMKRLRTFKGNKRFINSFYPQAVKLFNNTRNK